VGSRTAGVMKTLMRNGRDRRSENPFWATRYLSACFWLGPISGSHQGQRPQRLHRAQAILRAKTGRIHGCTRTLRKEVRFFPCTAGAVHTWPDSEVSECPLHVGFSNRPFWVKHFQAIHHWGVDVARGLALLFGIGTAALPSWGSKARWNNLLGGLAVRRTAGPSRHTNSPHPSSREGHHSTTGGARVSSYRI